MQCTEWANIHTEKVVASRHRTLGVTGIGYGASFWGDENVLKLITVTVTQLWEHTKNYYLLTFQKKKLLKKSFEATT